MNRNEERYTNRGEAAGVGGPRLQIEREGWRQAGRYVFRYALSVNGPWGRASILARNHHDAITRGGRGAVGKRRLSLRGFDLFRDLRTKLLFGQNQVVIAFASRAETTCPGANPGRPVWLYQRKPRDELIALRSRIRPPPRIVRFSEDGAVTPLSRSA